MANATLSASALATIRLARQHADAATRKQIKKDLFAHAKQHFGIPADIKLKVEMDGPLAGELRTRTGDVFPLNPATGKWVDYVDPSATTTRVLVGITADNLLRNVLVDNLIDLTAARWTHPNPPAGDQIALDGSTLVMWVDASDLEDTDL